MLREREFTSETVDRPVDNRYGAACNQGRADYDRYVEEQPQRYDAFERSFDNRTYAEPYGEPYYAEQEREYPREDYARREAYPRYENFGAPQNDAYGYNRQQTYDGYNHTNGYEYNGYAAPQTTTFEHVEYQAKKPAKRTLNAKSKMLIAVYFVLVAVIASLIIANVVAFGGGSVEAQAPAEAVYNEETLNMAVTADGSVVEMQEVRYIENYGYEKNTNWFDSFCDWVASISK